MDRNLVKELQKCGGWTAAMETVTGSGSADLHPEFTVTQAQKSMPKIVTGAQSVPKFSIAIAAYAKQLKQNFHVTDAHLSAMLTTMVNKGQHGTVKARNADYDVEVLISYANGTKTKADVVRPIAENCLRVTEVLKRACEGLENTPAACEDLRQLIVREVKGLSCPELTKVCAAVCALHKHGADAAAAYLGNGDVLKRYKQTTGIAREVCDEIWQIFSVHQGGRISNVETFLRQNYGYDPSGGKSGGSKGADPSGGKSGGSLFGSNGSDPSGGKSGGSSLGGEDSAPYPGRKLRSRSRSR